MYNASDHSIRFIVESIGECLADFFTYTAYSNAVARNLVVRRSRIRRVTGNADRPFSRRLHVEARGMRGAAKYAKGFGRASFSPGFVRPP